MRRPALTLVSAVVPVALLAGCGGGGSSGNTRGDSTVGRSGTSAPAAPVPNAAVPTGLAAPTSTTAPTGQAASESAASDPLGLGGLGASVSAAVGGIPTGAPGSAARSGGTGSAAPGVPQPSAALPASFPASFPLPRGYRAMGASDSGKHAHVQLSVPDAGAAFSDVQQRLPGAGYTVSDVSPLAQAGGFTNGHFAFAGHGVRGTVEASGAGSTGFLTVDYDR